MKGLVGGPDSGEGRKQSEKGGLGSEEGIWSSSHSLFLENTAFFSFLIGFCFYTSCPVLSLSYHPIIPTNSRQHYAFVRCSFIPHPLVLFSFFDFLLFLFLEPPIHGERAAAR